LWRYKNKIKEIGSVDPYLYHEGDEGLSDSKDLWPKITFADMHCYFIISKSAYTYEQFNAYKSLQAYRYFEAGHVRKILVQAFGLKRLLLATVRHSFKNEFARCWVICEWNGKVLSAHCDCVAGKGEVCSHVAATLFAVSEETRPSNEVGTNEMCEFRTFIHYKLIFKATVTELPCQWNIPAEKHVMAPIKKLKFSKRPLQRKPAANSEPLTRDEIKILCENIDAAGSSSAVGKYYLDQPTVTKYDLQDLKKPEYSEKSLEELRVIGKKTTIVFFFFWFLLLFSSGLGFPP
jgi:hypothetical protein